MLTGKQSYPAPTAEAIGHLSDIKLVNVCLLFRQDREYQVYGSIRDRHAFLPRCRLS